MLNFLCRPFFQQLCFAKRNTFFRHPSAKCNSVVTPVSCDQVCSHQALPYILLKTAAASGSGKTPGTSSPISPDTPLESIHGLIQGLNGAVKSAEEGRDILRKEGWILNNDGFSLERMASILFSLSYEKDTDNRSAKILRAIASQLTDHELNNHLQAFGTRMESLVNNQVNKAISVMEAKLQIQIGFLSQSTTETGEALHRITSAAESQEQTVSKLQEIDSRLSSTNDSMANNVKSHRDALVNSNPKSLA